MKKLLPLFLVAACGKDPNLAKVMVQAQAPKATCKTASLGGADIAVCEIPGKEKVTNWLAVYSKSLAQPFQAYPLDPQPKQDTPAPTPPPPPGEGSGANAPTPDAGTAK